MKLPLAIAAGLLLSACQTQQSQRVEALEPTRLPAPLSAAEQSAVRDAVRKSLKDPDSARFGSMAASSDGDSAGVKTVCGFVNAKNSYGGFTGDGVFAGVLAPNKGKYIFLVRDIGSFGDELTIVRTTCRKMGVNI